MEIRLDLGSPSIKILGVLTLGSRLLVPTLGSRLLVLILGSRLSVTFLFFYDSAILNFIYLTNTQIHIYMLCLDKLV